MFLLNIIHNLNLDDFIDIHKDKLRSKYESIMKQIQEKRLICHSSITSLKQNDMICNGSTAILRLKF